MKGFYNSFLSEFSLSNESCPNIVVGDFIAPWLLFGTGNRHNFFVVIIMKTMKAFKRTVASKSAYDLQAFRRVVVLMKKRNIEL